MMDERDHNKIALLSATRLVRLLKERRISSRELLELYVGRIERLNPTVNAVVSFDLDRARRDATAADERRAAGRPAGPLDGLPITVKESFDVRGLATTRGIPELKDNIAEEDAELVRRVRRAGAVIIGKTNVPTSLTDWQSSNVIHGRTNNPWDLERTPGGSSGGSAVAMAMGLSALEAGSDIGASIRNPAHYCGVFGHKPSYGIVPFSGHLPKGVVVPPDISVAGPLARSASDLDLALGVISGPEKRESRAWALRLPRARPRRPSDWRVAVMLSSPVCDVAKTVTDQIAEAVDRLVAYGVKVELDARPNIDFVRSHEIFMLMRWASPSMAQDDDGFRANVKTAGRENESWFGRIRARGLTLSHRDWLRLRNERERMRQAWDMFFEEFDALLCPTAASTAFPHNPTPRESRKIEVNGKPIAETRQLFWAGLGGIAYLPGTTAPVGLARDGLPVGVQIIGPYLADRQTIAMAKMIERAVGPFRAPPAAYLDI